MKIKGEVVGKPEPVTVVFERGSGDSLRQFVFVAEAVLSHDEFDKICPEPLPKTSMKPGSLEKKKLYDEEYYDRMDKYWKKRGDWTVLKSIANTEGLEWETVVATDPDTFHNYREELSTAGFTQAEIGHLIKAVNQANSVDEKKMQEALERFRLLQEENQGE